MLRYNSYESLSIAAAHFFVTECERSISRHGKFAVALSGGNTPKRLYQLLASAPFSKNINWKKVYIFFSDERYVPHNSTESNFKMAATALLRHIPIPPANIFSILTSSTPAKDAASYERDIKRILGKQLSFDLILLGVGEDGHTASLFPGNDILKEKRRWVKEVTLKEKEIYRISFTLPLINRAKQVLILVSGKDKAAVIKKITGKRKINNPLPVQLLKGNIIWMLN